ncbi:MAG: DegV family protein [Actinobacteria bacterium]|nr:DegV family protein [Actinomycetota bacterium]
MAVVTDSTADVETTEAERLSITVVPLNVHWNGETYKEKLELTIDEFYRKLREEHGVPKTSQPPSGEFETVYRRLLAEADGVVSIHISGKLSGTMNAAQVAARNVAPDRIVVVDSLTTSFGLGMITERVAKLAAEGASLEACADLARSLVPRGRLVVGLDTLEFLRRGGRIGRARALAANLLSIKLVFEVLDGEVVPVDRVRTRSAVVRRVAERVSELGPLEELAICYGDDPEPAQQLRALLEGAVPGLAILSGRIGPVLGAHLGPGVFAACALTAA